MSRFQLIPKLKDIDECAQNVCGGDNSGAACVNINGGYECICKEFSQKFDLSKQMCISTESSSFDYSDSYWTERGQCFSDYCVGDSIGMDTSYTDCCCGNGAQWMLDGEDQGSPCPSSASDEYAQLCYAYDSSNLQFRVRNYLIDCQN